MWDTIHLEGEAALLRATAAAFAVHEAELLRGEIDDLKLVLACEPGPLVAAASTPRMRAAALAVLAERGLRS